MRTKTIITLLLLFLFSASCAPKETPKKEIPKADNFSFVFEEYSCGYLPLLDILDTSKGTLIHMPLGETTSVEIPFVLSEDEMERIYQKIISTNYFDYPSEVRARGPVPFSTYRLKVINGDFTNDVKWTSDLQNAKPNVVENDNLVELFRLIQQIISSHPEYPEDKSGTRCA